MACVAALIFTIISGLYLVSSVYCFAVGTTAKAECFSHEFAGPDEDVTPFRGGGFFLLPEPVRCSGQVKFWQGYAYIKTVFDTYRFSVSVFRHNGTGYQVVSSSTRRVVISSQKGSWNLFNVTADDVHVECGDLIGVTVPESCRNNVCPLMLVSMTNESTHKIVNHRPTGSNQTNRRTDLRVLLNAVTIVQRGEMQYEQCI